MTHVDRALQGEDRIYQGADYYREFDLVDEFGDPIDLTDIDTIDFEGWDERQIGGSQEFVGTGAIVGSPTNGTISISIDKATTQAMTVENGAYTVDIEDSATAGSRRRAMAGAYNLHLTTITPP